MLMPSNKLYMTSSGRVITTRELEEMEFEGQPLPAPLQEVVHNRPYLPGYDPKAGSLRLALPEDEISSDIPLPMPECILENHYGSKQPIVFCENYILNLEEQGLGREGAVILQAARTEDPADLEQINWAWENILERFVPQEGWHLGYLPDSQALFSIPNGWEENNLV